MTDSQIVDRLRRIDEYQSKLSELIHEIEESDHPKAAEIAEGLWEQCWFAASAQHVALEHLNPKRWSIWKMNGDHYGPIVSRQWAKTRKIETVD